jgi:Fe-S cluster biogenesis protein NfuA
MNEEIKKIQEIINKLRPFLINDGGNIEFIKYEDNIVYIQLMGACANCQMIDLTLKDGIAAAIMSEVPEVKDVININ